MTTFAQRINETPMAPYTGLVRGMTREQKQIVVTFITESMEEPQPQRQVPAEFKRLRGMVNITKEEIFVFVSYRFMLNTNRGAERFRRRQKFAPHQHGFYVGSTISFLAGFYSMVM